ncbi:MAG: hypothetical protein E7290_15270 [Lachnospiraceae bacterium]|nr:hypothetical protein [Lachnospiraceae bacterium]
MSKEIKVVKDVIYPVHIKAADKRLRALCESYMLDKFGDDEDMLERAKARLDKELKAVIEYGFEPFYLHYHDLIHKNKLRPSQYYVKAGEAASSVICFLLGITKANPLDSEWPLYDEFFAGIKGNKEPRIFLEVDARVYDKVIQGIDELPGVKKGIALPIYQNGKVVEWPNRVLIVPERMAEFELSEIEDYQFANYYISANKDCERLARLEEMIGYCPGQEELQYEKLFGEKDSRFTKEDLLEAIIRSGVERKEAFGIVEEIRKGRGRSENIIDKNVKILQKYNTHESDIKEYQLFKTLRSRADISERDPISHADFYYKYNYPKQYGEIEAVMRAERLTVNSRNIWLDGIMGVAVGDALGVPVEFTKREELKENPVKEMLGYGAFYLPAGSWSDDTSMTLATMDSLKNGYDLHDIMKKFISWIREGEYASVGRAFDVGNICHRAISRYQRTGDIEHCGCDKVDENGNGSLMRIIPVCLYVYGKQRDEGMSDEEAIRHIHEVSALTHAHVRSLIACGLYYFIVKSILDNEGTLEECIQSGIYAGFDFYEARGYSSEELEHYKRIRQVDIFRVVPDTDISSSGYVVDSLEAALWCLLNTDTYEACELLAVNLGDDTDTIAAIAGGLAGLFYGYLGIPVEWLEKLQRREWIEELCTNMEER